MSSDEATRLEEFKNWAFSVIFNDHVSEEQRGTFLACFRLFQRPSTLLQLLLNEYQHNQTLLERKRQIAKFILYWMKGYHEHDLNSPKFRVWMRICEDKYVSNQCKLLYLRHHGLLRVQKYNKESKVQTCLQFSSPKQFTEHLNLNGIPSMPLSSHSTASIAHALTRYEVELLLKVTSSELLVWTWQKKVNHKVPNIDRLAARFNQVSYWAATEVMLCIGVFEQTAALTKILKIAKKCDKLNNFNTLMALMSGVNHVAITRLKGVWDGVPSKLLHWFRDAEEMMLPSSNFKNYRAQLKKRKAPIIPYTALVMKDLTFLAEGNDMYSGDQINMEFVQLLQNQLSQFSNFQAELGSYQLHEEAYQSLKTLYHSADEHLYQWSKDTVESMDSYPRKPCRSSSSTNLRELSPRQRLTMEGSSTDLLKKMDAGQVENKRKAMHHRHSSVDI